MDSAYASLAENARQAFAREYVTPAGRLMNDAETAYALAIAFDLLPTPEQRQRAGDRLSELVRESGYQIRTGFVGTPLICEALCNTGHYQAAYRLSFSGMSFLALPGHDGRDHGLGTLGLHAAGWIDQPRRDDLFQPLCARGRRGLDAPDDWRFDSDLSRATVAWNLPASRRRTDSLPGPHLTPYGLAQWHGRSKTARSISM